MPHQCTNCDRTFDDGSKEMLSGCPECGGTKFQFRPDGFDGGSGESGAVDAGPTDDSGGTDPVAESPPEPTDRPGDTVTRTVGNAAATVRDLVGGSASEDATRAKPPQQTAGPASADGRESPADGGDDDIIVAESDPTAAEDTAQADARTQLVEPDEMPGTDGFDPAETDGGESTDQPADDDRSMADDPGRLADTPADVAETAETTTANAATDEPAVDGAGSDAESEQSVADEPDAERSVADEPDAERTDRPELSELRKELNDQFESIRVVEPGQYELNLMELYDREEYIIALQEDGRYSIQVPDTWRQADA
ncbi:OapC/ArvC family zinc-ribbon domain-containing protein [Halosimplex salinum]|uniref:OapC/ArvC family zinc-ribbon domain-containing protein n=1 Tax=Halosimplex salinum TaxID=1710538 RepID=UPI000F462CB9|nr:Zn-ribbon containing protein [Halosimplex salinum]